MDNRAVAGKLFADLPIDSALVGAKMRISRKRFGDDGLQRRRGHVRNVERSDPTAALHQSHYGFLGRWLAISAIASPAAHERLVSLDEFTSTADRIHFQNPHRFTQPMTHEPSCFERNAESPVQLLAADAFLA